MVNKIVENFKNKVYTGENGQALFELDLNDLVEEIQKDYQEELDDMTEQLTELETQYFLLQDELEDCSEG